MRRMDLIDIYILEILQTYASEKNKMTQEQLIKHLEDEYLMKVSRPFILILATYYFS